MAKSGVFPRGRIDQTGPNLGKLSTDAGVDLIVQGRGIGVDLQATPWRRRKACGLAFAFAGNRVGLRWIQVGQGHGTGELGRIGSTPEPWR